MQKLLQWFEANKVMLVNAASLVGTTAVTSVLGFVYWWIAARRFTPEAVGIASAAVSAMTLLGGLCILGLGTLLITELPRQPGRAESLISTALIVVGLAGGAAGFVFAVFAPYISTGFRLSGANIVSSIIFASGVSLTATSTVLDQSLVGLLRGDLQFWRNTLFALSKLAMLFIVSIVIADGDGMLIYATWAVGNVLSFMALAVRLLFEKRRAYRRYLPQWGLLKKLGPAAIQHHLLNLTLQAPALILPVLVTALLSATMNAWFYVAWMIASFVFLVPNVLTIVLHAMNAAQQATLAKKARVTLSLGLVTSLAANCLFQLATTQVLSLFGSAYAAQAALTLRILVIAAFPLIIKYHYIAICRIQDRIARAMFGMLPGGLLELGAAVIGARLGGLTGLSTGWVVAIFLESFFMVNTVYRCVLGPGRPQGQERMLLQWRPGRPQGQERTPLPYTKMLPPIYGETRNDWQDGGAQALWLMETMPLPAIGQSYMGAIWLSDTLPLPVVGQRESAWEEGAIMNFPAFDWGCHSERSEESLSGHRQILRCAQNDKSLPILVGNLHNCAPTYRLRLPAIEPGATEANQMKHSLRSYSRGDPCGRPLWRLMPPHDEHGRATTRDRPYSIEREEKTDGRRNK